MQSLPHRGPGHVVLGETLDDQLPYHRRPDSLDQVQVRLDAIHSLAISVARKAAFTVTLANTFRSVGSQTKNQSHFRPSPTSDYSGLRQIWIALERDVTR